MESTPSHNFALFSQEKAWGHKIVPENALQKLEPQRYTLVLLATIVFILTMCYYQLKNRNKSSFNCVLPCLKYGSVRMLLVDEFTSLFQFHSKGLVLFDELVPRLGTIFKLPFFGFSRPVFVSDVNVIEKLLKSNSPDILERPQLIFNLVFPNCIKNGLLVACHKIWASHRKSISPAVKYGPLTKYFSYTVNATQSIITEANNKATHLNRKEISNPEMKEIFEQNAMKIIMNIVFGDELSTFPEDELMFARKCFENFKTIMGERALNPFLLIPPIWSLHPKKRVYESSNSYFLMFANKVINIYRSKMVENDKHDSNKMSFPTIINQMINDGFSDEEISAEILTFLPAGHETVLIALDMLIFHLASNPEYQKRCQEEVDEILQHKTSENSFNKISKLNFSDVSQLKYLERCVLESLRITPTVPVFLRSLKTPLKINENFTLDPTDIVVVSPWAVHRNPDYYPNPEQFDPDRFLPENVKKRHPYAYIPFSLGSRNCIGWKIALIELKVIMAGILSCFEMETTDKLTDVKFYYDVTLKPERPFNITFKVRHNNK